MEIVTADSSEQVNQAASHTLFVEGEPNSLDPTVLRELLRELAVRTKPLGPSYGIKSAAQALHSHHKNYYFVIDRDHHEEDEVESSWRSFPDASKHNLLIWRKRELQNYFLDVDYLSKSQFLTKTRGYLEKALLKHAKNRVFFDIANHTIATVREIQKLRWVEDFTDPTEFSSAEKAMERLNNYPPLCDRVKSTKKQMSHLADIFDALLNRFLGGTDYPELGTGQWQHLMRGKQLLNSLINECFSVIDDSTGQPVTGNAAVNLVARQLLTLQLKEQPADFQTLRTLLSAMVSR